MYYPPCNRNRPANIFKSLILTQQKYFGNRLVLMDTTATIAPESTAQMNAQKEKFIRRLL
jgi:hypothetical protein